MGVFAGPEITESGLVLALDAANRKSYPGSGTTWTDLSGRGNNGTLVNGVGYSGSNLGSLSFDGVNDYAQTIKNDIPNNSSFSLSCWFRINVVNSQFRPLIDAGNLGTGNIGYCLAVSSSNRVYIACNSGFASADISLSTNTWYNLVGTANFGTPYLLNVYLNGSIRDVSINTTNSMTNSVTFIRIGNNISGGAQFFPGNIAQASIYNRALTAQEISQNFNALRGRYGI